MHETKIANASNVSLRFDGKKRDETPDADTLVKSFSADILLRLEDGNQISVGSVDLDRVFLDAPPDELWDWCDGQSAQLAEMYEDLFRAGSYRWILNELILISHIRVQAGFRGRGIGTAALKKVLRRYARDCDAFALKPFGTNEDGSPSMVLSKRLKAFYERLGFRVATKSFMLYGIDVA